VTNQLELSNVINISISQAQAGVNAYNTSNLALFTDETPADSFGDDGYKIYLEPTEVGVDFGTDSTTFAMANAVFSQQPNILNADGALIIIPFIVSETLATAITRTKGLVQYFGLMSTIIESQVDMLAAAAVVQPLNKIAFFVQKASTAVDTGGALDLLRTGGFYKSRGLFYGDSVSKNALVMQASYAGRALSVNFSGSNTTLTMHLKDLTGVQPDPTMTQTLLNKCTAAGADVYCSLQGVPKVFTSGANKYFDQVYNLLWFVGELQVEGFNFLAQSGTKIPQTEGGMDGLKSAYRNVCVQGVTNQYMAPGKWTSPTTFGNQEDLYSNIGQYGYYIYSVPVAQQLPADRAARKAPLVQIAVKEAGAIQSSDVIVNVNA
jgi:hypothetical protein